MRRRSGRVPHSRRSPQQGSVSPGVPYDCKSLRRGRPGPGNLLRAYRHLDRFDNRAAFRTWLFRIATNCSVDLLRRRQRLKDAGVVENDAGVDPIGMAASNAPGPDRRAIAEQIRRMVDVKLSQLSPVERTAFLLRHVEGMSIDEISKVLGRNNGATKLSRIEDPVSEPWIRTPR